jgi:type I restriction enzyme, S subunit
MSKKFKAKIPELRFFEFSEDLDLKYLGEIFDFKNGINADKSQYGQGIKFINVLDIINRDPIYYDSIIGRINISDQEFQKSNVQYGDVLFQRSSEIREEAGQSNIYLDKNRDATFGGFVIRGRPKVKFNPIYFNYLLKTSSVRKEITDRSGGSTRFNVGQDSLSQIPVLVCSSLDEQEKIASFFEAIATRLTQLRRKYELLQTYKRGVMQKIFSQEVRFSRDNGKSFADWEERKLGELTYKAGNKNKDNIQYPIYSINNKTGFVPQSEQFEGVDSNERGYNITLYKIISKNTFAYNPARINVGSIGFSGELENIIVSSLYVCFKTKNEIDDMYLFQYFNTSEFNKSVLRSLEGGVRDYLFYENFSDIKVPLPSIREQVKIVEFLKLIDKKIEAISQLIDLTEQFKKGLLQKMFV